MDLSGKAMFEHAGLALTGFQNKEALAKLAPFQAATQIGVPRDAWSTCRHLVDEFK